MPTMFITRRLYITQAIESDVERLVEACNDPVIQRVIGFNRPYTRADAMGYIFNAVPAGWTSGRRFTWILRDDEQKLVGQISLTMLPNMREASIGYWLHPAYQRQGYLTEAGEAVLAGAFGRGGLARVRWQAYAINHASAALAAKLGFRYDGLVEPGALGWNVAGPAWTGHVDATDERVPQQWDIPA